MKRREQRERVREDEMDHQLLSVVQEIRCPSGFTECRTSICLHTLSLSHSLRKWSTMWPHSEQVGRMSEKRGERERVCSFKRAAERRTCGRCISASSALREKTKDRQRLRETEWQTERGDKGRVGEVIVPERASESLTQPCNGGCSGHTGSPQRSATEPLAAIARECHGHRWAQIAAPAMRPAEEAAVSSACFGHVSRRLSRLFRRLPKSRSWSEGLRLLRRSSSSGALVLSGNKHRGEERN